MNRIVRRAMTRRSGKTWAGERERRERKQRSEASMSAFAAAAAGLTPEQAKMAVESWKVMTTNHVARAKRQAVENTLRKEGK